MAYKVVRLHVPVHSVSLALLQVSSRRVELYTRRWWDEGRTVGRRVPPNSAG